MVLAFFFTFFNFFIELYPMSVKRSFLVDTAYKILLALRKMMQT